MKDDLIERLRDMAGPVPQWPMSSSVTAGRELLLEAAAALAAAREREARLREALASLLPMAERGAAKVEHAGFCGPNAYCDTTCMAAAHDSDALVAARATLQEGRDD